MAFVCPANPNNLTASLKISGRDGNDGCVAKLKRGRKFHERNLDTTDFALAKRKLREFEDEVERKKASGASTRPGEFEIGADLEEMGNIPRQLR
jgi:hypothetical protein